MWWVVRLAPNIFMSAPENGASSKIEDVLAEDGGLLHVLPLAVHLNFFDGQVGGTILDHSYFLKFFVGPLLHAEKLWVVVVGLQDFIVSPGPLLFFLDFGT